MNQDVEQMLSAAGVNLATGRTRGDGVVFYNIAGGDPAVTLWHTLAARLQALGHWPLICGDLKEFDRLEEQLEQPSRAADVLAQVPITAPMQATAAAKADQRKQLIEMLKAKGDTNLIRLLQQEDAQAEKKETPDYAAWVPRDPGKRQIVSAYGHGKTPPSMVVLAIIPSGDPADAAAYMMFGGFNDCPATALHVAWHRDWQRRFGAVPIAITGDVVEMHLTKPVTSKEDALTLATEQYAYSPDIVDQGTQTVYRLGNEIWQSPYWFFWWD